MPELLQGMSAENFRIPIISEQFPFFFDISITTLNRDCTRFCFDAHLTYFDIAEHKYNQKLEIDVDSHLGPNLMGDRGYEKIEKGLTEIQKSIVKVAETIKSKK